MLFKRRAEFRFSSDRRFRFPRLIRLAVLPITAPSDEASRQHTDTRDKAKRERENKQNRTEIP